MACIWKRSCDGTKTGTILSRKGDVRLNAQTVNLVTKRYEERVSGS